MSNLKRIKAVVALLYVGVSVGLTPSVWCAGPTQAAEYGDRGPAEDAVVTPAQENLLVAIKRADLQSVRQLVETEQVPVTFKTEIGVSPLSCALGIEAAWKIQHGELPQEPSRLVKGLEAQPEALERSETDVRDMVTFLLEETVKNKEGFDINQLRMGAIVCSDTSILARSAYARRWDVVATLLEQFPGLDLSERDSFHSLTALHYAALDGRSDIVEKILAHPNGEEMINAAIVGTGLRGPGVLDGEDYGVTPLHCAAKGGHLDIVRLLLERGANPNLATYKERRTPLMTAVMAGHEGIVRLLLSQPSSDFTVTDKRGKTAKDYAGRSQNAKAILGLFEEIEANSSALFDLVQTGTQQGLQDYLQSLGTGIQLSLNYVGTDSQGNQDTVLGHAVRCGNEEAVIFLLNVGKYPVEKNLKNPAGDTPLHIALKTKQPEMAKILIDHGKIDIKQLDGDGNSSVHLAIRNELLDTVQLLAQQRGWFAAKSNLLQMAARCGYVPAVKLFLSKEEYLGSKSRALEVVNESLGITLDNNHFEIAKLLIQDPRAEKVEPVETRRRFLQVVPAGDLELLRLVLQHSKDGTFGTPCPEYESTKAFIDRCFLEATDEGSLLALSEFEANLGLADEPAATPAEGGLEQRQEPAVQRRDRSTFEEGDPDRETFLKGDWDAGPSEQATNEAELMWWITKGGLDRAQGIQRLLKDGPVGFGKRINTIRDQKGFLWYALMREIDDREKIREMFEQREKGVKQIRKEWRTSKHVTDVILRELIKRKDKLTINGKRGVFTYEGDVLCCVAETGRTILMRKILTHWLDVDMNAMDRKSLYTPLSRAARYKNHDMMKFLLTYTPKSGKKCDVNKRSSGDSWRVGNYPGVEWARGSRALHVAAQQGDLEAVNLLLEYGADPNRTPRGATTVHFAVQSGNPKVVERLLKIPNIEVAAKESEEITIREFVETKSQLLEVAEKYQKILAATQEKYGLNEAEQEYQQLLEAVQNNDREILKLKEEQGLTRDDPLSWLHPEDRRRREQKLNDSEEYQNLELDNQEKKSRIAELQTRHDLYEQWRKTQDHLLSLKFNPLHRRQLKASQQIGRELDPTQEWLESQKTVQKVIAWLERAQRLLADLQRQQEGFGTISEDFARFEKGKDVHSMLEANQNIRVMLDQVDANSRELFQLVEKGTQRNFLEFLNQLEGKVKFSLNYVGTDSQGNQDTVLGHAVRSGNQDAVNFLLSVGPVSTDVSRRGPHGDAPLHIALRTGQWEIAAKLIADPRTKIRSRAADDSSPLALALENQQVELARQIYSHPKFYFFEERDGNGWPLLHAAAKNGKADSVKFLMGLSDIDVNGWQVVENKYESAFGLAVRNGHKDVVRTFLADPRVDVEVFVPLPEASWPDGSKIVATYRTTALSRTVILGDVEWTKMILSCNRDLTSLIAQKDGLEKTALDYAKEGVEKSVAGGDAERKEQYLKIQQLLEGYQYPPVEEADKKVGVVDPGSVEADEKVSDSVTQDEEEEEEEEAFEEEDQASDVSQSSDEE